MRKYLTVFSVSWQNGLIYRLNLLLWRIRSIILIITVYFLWDAVFTASGHSIIFGYSRAKILTYVFLTLMLRSLVLGVRSIDAAGEIAEGSLSNYLVKPISYHLYWFTRDLADKLLNIIFSVFEISFLYLLLRPPIYLAADPLVFIHFAFFLTGAVILNFIFGALSSNFSFWTPGNSWGFWFLFLVFQDFLGGVMFPLDIFPLAVYNLLTLLPFPYLIFFPINVYVGKIAGPDLVKGYAVLLFWLMAGSLLLFWEWRQGLKAYQAEGR